MSVTKFTEEQHEWLSKTAWKKFTVSQIAEKLKVTPSCISLYFKRKGIECATIREIITKEIFIMADKGLELSPTQIAAKFGCSIVIVKEIFDTYDFSRATKPGRPTKEAPIIKEKESIKNGQRDKTSEAAIVEYKNKLMQIKKARAQFAVYNQTGSDILDDLRNIKTTKREDKYSTNI